MLQRVALLAALVEHRVRGGGLGGGRKRGAAGPLPPSFFFLSLPKNPIFSFFFLTVFCFLGGVAAEETDLRAHQGAVGAYVGSIL